MIKGKLLLYYNDLVFQPSAIFLEKDFGQVPFVISTLYNYDLEYIISTNSINKDFISFKSKSVLQFEKQFKFLSAKIDFLKILKIYYHLYKNRNQYTALVFFPFVPLSDYIFLKLFKYFNKKSVIYLKLDANIDMINKLEFSYKNENRSVSKYFRTYFHYKKLLENSDLISFETKEVGEKLKNNFLGCKGLSNKIINVFNGVSEKSILDFKINILEYDKKENIVLIIGRHGTIEKNTELVFKATQHLNTDWKFIFLGPVEDSFLEVINIYKNKVSNFDEKYIFKGLIANKKEYFNYLNKSKILLLTSNKEGFPMVFPEALYFTNYIITTDVSGSSEATRNNELGIIYKKNDYLELESHLKKLFDNPDILKEYIDDIRRYSRNYFVWEKSLGQSAFQKLFRNK